MFEQLSDGGLIAYVIVFLAAATPVVEVLVVIPAGVAAGLPVLPTALIALAGNVSTVAIVVVAGDRLIGWWRGRRPVDPDASEGPSRRSERAQRIIRRWGVPGLALLAPVSTGSHVAAMAALALGAPRTRVLGWMVAGLVAWVAVAAGASALGVELFTSR